MDKGKSGKLSKKLMNSGKDTNKAVFNLIIGLVLNGTVLYYLYLLHQESCDCSNIWEKQYVLYFTVAIMIISTLNTLLHDLKHNMLYKVVLFIVTMGSIVNIYALYNYVNKMKQEKCLCATQTHDQLFLYLRMYNIFQIVGLVLSICMFVYLLFLLSRK